MSQRAIAGGFSAREGPKPALPTTGSGVRRADLAERVERVEALVDVLMSRIADLEGEAAPPVDVEAATTLKGASHATGFSVSAIRKWIASGKVSAVRIGGRVIIDRRSLPPRRSAK